MRYDRLTLNLEKRGIRNLESMMPDAAAQWHHRISEGLKWKNLNSLIHNLINPQPYRDDIEYLDIFEEGDEIVEGLGRDGHSGRTNGSERWHRF